MRGVRQRTTYQAENVSSETEIIERIWSKLPTRPRKGDASWLRLGVGDDAAVIRGGAVRGKSGQGLADWVLSCDGFLEGVHFLPRVHSPGAIGYKALARATSDLAAMGSAPRWFMLSLALPANRTGKWLDGVLTGMARAAREFGMVVIGGDTSRTHEVAINLTVGGQVPPGCALTRSGAMPGDAIYVTGHLGAAELGLGLVLRNMHRDPRWKRLLAQHMHPQIQLELGQWLAGKNPAGLRIASAAIDTSDGLSTDLNHICQCSGVGARLYAAQIPLVRVPESLSRRGFDPLKLALHGGEDYQLLFTVPQVTARRLPPMFREVMLTRIGEIVRLKGRGRASRVDLVDASGKISPLVPRGWDPFLSR